MFYIFSLNKRRTWASRRASLQRNAVRLMFSFGFATLTTVIWHQFYKAGIHLTEKTHEILGVAILVLAAIFAIAGAMILDGVWEHVQKMTRYVLTGNQRKFMLKRDERMPIAMHLVLGVAGLSVIALLGAADYPSSWSGIVIVFPTSCAMMLYFVVIGDMQDTTNSPWFEARVPKEWLKQDVDKYFRELRDKKQTMRVASKPTPSAAAATTPVVP